MSQRKNSEYVFIAAMIMLIVVITILHYNKHYYGIKMLITMKTTMIKKMIVKIVRMKCL